MNPRDTYPWLWDLEMDRETFSRLLGGGTPSSGRDWRWALIRLIEYAPYDELISLLPREHFITHWPDIAPHIRSSSRREGMDFVHRKLSGNQKAG